MAKECSLESQPPFSFCIFNRKKEEHVGGKKSCDPKLHEHPKIGLMKCSYACLITLFMRQEYKSVVAFLLVDLRTLSNSCLSCVLTPYLKKIQACDSLSNSCIFSTYNTGILGIFMVSSKTPNNGRCHIQKRSLQIQGYGVFKPLS